MGQGTSTTRSRGDKDYSSCQEAIFSHHLDGDITADPITRSRFPKTICILTAILDFYASYLELNTFGDSFESGYSRALLHDDSKVHIISAYPTKPNIVSLLISFPITITFFSQSEQLSLLSS